MLGQALGCRLGQALVDRCSGRALGAGLDKHSWTDARAGPWVQAWTSARGQMLGQALGCRLGQALVDRCSGRALGAGLDKHSWTDARAGPWAADENSTEAENQTETAPKTQAPTPGSPSAVDASSEESADAMEDAAAAVALVYPAASTNSKKGGHGNSHGGGRSGSSRHKAFQTAKGWMATFEREAQAEAHAVLGTYADNATASRNASGKAWAEDDETQPTSSPKVPKPDEPEKPAALGIDALSPKRWGKMTSVLSRKDNLMRMNHTAEIKAIDDHCKQTMDPNYMPPVIPAVKHDKHDKHPKPKKAMPPSPSPPPPSTAKPSTQTRPRLTSSNGSDPHRASVSSEEGRRGEVQQRDGGALPER
ncbi:hypothetical protein CYMTET_20812 [Cymbomonas tetramitiformis]|uniref:Uncharacterized protein n=1 Tax=Cymbomonas tetramitiformis TaxID=36881 RepID=A0AAE0G3C0_9CHLO|nr:hypothetical protein CYMTET_20812 [Cymbomonas tetramitiformis]